MNTTMVMGCKGHVKYHTIDHKQGLGFIRIQCKNNNYTLIKERLPISPQIQAHPIATKINFPNSQGYCGRFGFTILSFKFTRKILLACQSFQIVREISPKSFINILIAYGLDQQKESNIGVVKNSR
jgi:hypothetical protein